MTNKNPQIDAIMQEIYDLLPKSMLPMHIFNIALRDAVEKRKEEIKQFITTLINGDSITSYLVLDTNEKRDVWIYILTDLRLIVIPITNLANIESQSFALVNISNIERRLIDSDKFEIIVRLNNTDKLGIKMNKTDQKVINFFQQLEQAWVQRS